MLNLFQKNREQNQDLKKIEDFFRHHIEEFKSQEKNIPEDIFSATLFLLEEILDMYQSIRALNQKGHFRSCIVLSRFIFENGINLRYMYQADTEQRAKNFKLFSLREYLNRASKIENMPPEMETYLDTLKDQVREYSPAGKSQAHWDGKSVWDKANELKSEASYDIYRHLSNYLHSKYQGNRDLSVERPYNNFLRKLVFKDVLVYTLPALVAICERFDLDGGIIMLSEYPKPGSSLYYATNPKRREAEMKEMKPD